MLCFGWGVGVASEKWECGNQKEKTYSGGEIARTERVRNYWKGKKKSYETNDL